MNYRVLLHVASLWRQPSLLAMTHMRWSQGHRVRESTEYAQNVALCVGGLRAWPIERCSSKDGGRSERERETPTSCKRTGAKTKLDQPRLPSAPT